MSDDLEPIPLERPGSRPTAGAEPPAPATVPVPAGPRRRRWAAAAVLGLAAIAGGAGWRLSVEDSSPVEPDRASGRAAPPAEGDLAYPSVRGVPPHLSSVGELLVTRSDADGVGTLLLINRSGEVVWELPRLGAWDPAAVAWSPGGRRFLFQISRGQETVSRVVMLPEGVDLTVSGALAWIDDDELLVWRDGRLGRLDVASSALVQGEPLTQYVTAQAGTRGQAALVILAGDSSGPGSAASAAGRGETRTLVRFVDHDLRTRDAPAPAGIVDCFSPIWRDGGRRLLLACKRFDPPDTAAFEIDAESLRWTRLPTGSLQPAAVHPLLDRRSLVVETVGNCGDNPIDLWLVGDTGASRRLGDDGTGPWAEADVAPDLATMAAVTQPCGRTPHIVEVSLPDGPRRDLTPGRQPLWSPARG